MPLVQRMLGRMSLFEIKLIVRKACHSVISAYRHYLWRTKDFPDLTLCQIFNTEGLDLQEQTPCAQSKDC